MAGRGSGRALPFAKGPPRPGHARRSPTLGRGQGVPVRAAAGAAHGLKEAVARNFGLRLFLAEISRGTKYTQEIRPDPLPGLQTHRDLTRVTAPKS